jgi:hypothetical protein
VSGEMAFVVVNPRRGSFAGMRWGRRRNVFELDMLLYGDFKNNPNPMVTDPI